MKSFYRLLKLKTYFKDNENTKLTTEQQIFQPQKKEKWTPNKNNHTVLTYTEATQRELEKEQTKMKEKPYNLIKNERTSMKELREREGIMITKADKGDAVVIVGVKDFLKETERQLNNTKNHRKLQEDPTATNMKLVNDTIERSKKKKKLTHEKVAVGLKRNDPKIPKFYLRPKTQKESNSGRPVVVSSVKRHTKYFEICQLPPSTNS